jgi:protein-disulfide isomerase
MSDRFERLTVSILAAAAVTMAAVLVHREVVGSAQARATASELRPQFMSTWQQLADAGIRIDSGVGSIMVIEFADFECPFCRRFDSTLRSYQTKHPGTVSRVFVHDPLAMHRFAMPAARVAECAAEQGRFEKMHDLLFQRQDSFGLRPWSAFAVDAGVSDRGRFDRCVSEARKFPRIESGVALAEKYNVRATPTVIVNGWRFRHPPTESDLSTMIAALQSGRDPFPR